MTPIVRPRLELLDTPAVERIVGEACRVLEKVGISVENEEATEICLAGGAIRAGERVLIPERLVRASLESAPSRFVVGDRAGEPVLALGDGAVHFDPGSAAVSLLDPTTRRKREATSTDLARLARLVDRLPGYAAQSTALVPADVPAAIGDRHRLFLALRHCRKPIITGTFRADGFAPMHAMLVAVRGSEAALGAMPLAIFDCCVSPPLMWSDLTARALVDCARTGVPAQVIPMPLTGATAPVTLRETVVQHTAENLSGLVLHQLAGPGAPFVFGGACSSFDMRHGTTPMGSMETMMLASAYAQVGRWLGLPTHGYLVVSDAKTADYQAGMESGLGALVAALSGIDVVSGAGMLDFLLTQSLEKILLDHEACSYALRAVRGLEPGSGETVELIAELVERGEFLSHPHTRANWRRELSQVSPLVDRGSHGDWEAAGAMDAAERAAAEVERLLGRPDGEGLPDDVAAELDAIMAHEAKAAGLDVLPTC
jgi:trimethylamine---corrinoid protein Co-methyltransferase